MNHPEFWILPKFGIFYAQKALEYDFLFSLLRNWREKDSFLISNFGLAIISSNQRHSAAPAS
jgi:hypothetical protein